MAGNTDGNIMGTKPVVGSKSDEIMGGQDSVTVMSVLKRLQNMLGLGAFGFGFNGDLEVFSDGSSKAVHDLQRLKFAYERWYGHAAVTIGTSHWADSLSLQELGDNLTNFQVDAGNDVWGEWVQIFGSDDLPDKYTTFKIGRVTIVEYENTDVTHLLQFAFGESADIAIRNDDFTEIIVHTGTNTDFSYSDPIDIPMERVPKGTNVWARNWAQVTNTSTLDFLFSIIGFTH
jgi:hypothetical protein